MPLVEREVALAAVDDLLARPPGRVLVVAGPRGSGRSSLLAESVERGERLRREVLACAGSPTRRGERLGALAPWLGAGLGDDLRAVTAALRDRARDARRSLLFVVDDADLLDDASIAVVELLVRAGDASVVASTPTGHPVAGLAGAGPTRRVAVAPLSDAGIDAAVQAWLGGPLDGWAARSLTAGSGGRPSLIRAAIDGASQAGRLVPLGPDGWRLLGRGWVEEPLLAAVEAHLAPLDAGARRALELVCVARALGHRVLVDLAGEGSVEALERASLVEVRHEGRRADLVAVPPFVPLVVRRGLSTAARAGHAAALAAALDATGARRRDDGAALARLRIDAGGAAGWTTVLGAARLARQEGDHGEAERLARLAGAATAAAEPVLELASLLHEQGQARASEEELVAARPGSDRDRALVALARANNLEWSLQAPAAAAEVLDTAARQVQDRQLVVELHAATAGIEHLCGRPDLAIDALRTLLDRASAPRARHRVLNNLASALAFAGNVDEVRGVVDQALVAAGALDGEPVVPDPGFLFLSLAFATCEAGLLDEAEGVADAAYAAATGVDESGGMGWFALVRGRIALHRGRLDDAERALAEARWRLGALDLDGPVRWARAGEVLVAAARGLPAREVVARAEPLDAPERPGTAFGLHRPDVLRARGWAAVVGGAAAAGLALVREAAALARSGGVRSAEVLAWLDLVRLASHPSEADDAAERLAGLAAALDSPLASAAAELARATAGDDDSGLEAAAAAFETLGMDLVAAEAWTAAASRHHRHRRGRAEAGARQHVEELRRRAGAPWATPALAGTDARAALTPRELQVARLAATGMRTDAIAAQLDVAFRTVENHLHRAYGKLGVAGKHELADVLSSP